MKGSLFDSASVCSDSRLPFVDDDPYLKSSSFDMTVFNHWNICTLGYLQKFKIIITKTISRCHFGAVFPQIVNYVVDPSYSVMLKSNNTLNILQTASHTRLTYCILYLLSVL